jgi:hypothetical protein
VTMRTFYGVSLALWPRVRCAAIAA